jgi:hypothetical protein
VKQKTVYEYADSHRHVGLLRNDGFVALLAKRNFLMRIYLMKGTLQIFKFNNMINIDNSYKIQR